MRALLAAVAVACVLASGCGCDRGTGLSGQAGELVVVVLEGDAERLTRQAQVNVEPVVMDERGDGVVRLRNIGAASLTLLSVRPVGGSAALSLDDAPGLTLPRDGEVTLAAHFAPPTDADVTRPTVEHRADFEIRVQGGRPGEEVATVALVGLAVARDCYVPAVLDFGLVPLGQHVTLPLVLENGKAFPAVTEVSAPGGVDPLAFALLSVPPFEVNPGQRVEVPVSFGPLEEREYQAQVRVRRAATCAEAVTRLVGTGSSQALTWTPLRLDFGRVPFDQPVLRTVTVINGSGAPLALGGLTLEAPFSLVQPVPAEVPARGSATFTVACGPTALGRFDGTLRFAVGTVEGLSGAVPMTCLGGAPRIRLSPAPELLFGQVPLGGTASRRLSVQNVGTPPGFPGDTSTNLRLGLDGTVPWVALVPANPQTLMSDFSVVAPAGYDPVAGLPAVGGLNILDLDVRLTASSAPRKEAVLSVYSNDPLLPVASVRLYAQPTQPGSCNLLITPEGLSLGDVPRGAHVERTVTLTALTGTRECLVAMDLAPGTAPTFSLLDPNSTFVLNEGHSKSVTVRGTALPALPFGASARGFLRVQAGLDPIQLIPLEMRVANCLVVDQSEINFGITRVGCRSGSKAINVYNVCGVPLTIERIAVRPVGAPFVLTSTPTLPAGGLEVRSGQPPTTVHVAFAPSMVATSQAVLEFDVREGGLSRTVPVVLRGEGDLLGVQTDRWSQVANGKLDVLFVVDDSCSMANEQASLAANFAHFIAAADLGNVDYHLGVTTTDVFNIGGRLVGQPRYLTSSTPQLGQAFAAHVTVGIDGTGLEQPLEAAARAVSEPNLSGANAGFLRNDAALAVVLVTDAVDQSTNPVAIYRATLLQAKGGKAERLSVNVVGPFSPQGPTCLLDSTVDDGRYASLVSSTNGLMADICTTNWAQDLEAIGQNIVQPRRDYQLTGQPANASAIEVRVNGVLVSGWTWDPVTNSVVFSAVATPPGGSSLTLSYGTACF